MISGGGFNSRRLGEGWEKTKINRLILGHFRDNRGGEWPSGGQILRRSAKFC